MLNFLKFIFTILLPFLLSFFFILVGLTYLNFEKQINWWAALISIVSTAIFILIIIRWRKFGKRCKACGKWGAIEKVKNETEKKGSVNIVVKNEDGRRRIKSGHKYIHTKYFRCKNCGREFSRSEDYERVNR